MSGSAVHSAPLGLTGAEGPPRPLSRNLIGRLTLLLAKSISLALLYYVLVVVSMKFRLSTSTLALLWPPNALLVAALVLSPKRRWWIYLLAVVPAHIAGMAPYHLATGWIVYQLLVNSVLAVSCVGILERFKPDILYFEKLREVLVFLAVAVAIPGLVSLSGILPIMNLASSAALFARGWSRDLTAVWTGRWITNTASLVIFVPMILVTVTRGRAWVQNVTWKRAGEAVLLIALLITFTFQVYDHVYIVQDAPATVFLVPITLLLWSAVRFGPAGACFSIAALVCISTWCAYQGEGPFLRSSSVEHVTILQISWIAAAFPVLSLAAVVQERKVAAAASLESDRRFRYLITEAPIGIALEDLDGNLQFANPALCSMLGYSQRELTGMNCSQFATTEDEQEDWEQFQELRAGLKSSYQIEKRYLRKDGRQIWGRLNVSMLTSPDQPTMVLATVEDITEKRQALEELQRAHQELRQLTPRLFLVQEEERRRISRELHDDFGQRLSLVFSELDTLKRELPTKTPGRTRIRKLQDELDVLVADVHNMSHQLHSYKLDLLGLSVALKDLCQLLAGRHQIVINLTADKLPELHKETALCLYRVAQEALANAVKHSKSARVDVSVVAEGSSLRLRVRDFGVGFDPAKQRNGLGLISMQERLRMIGGVLRFNSVSGGGTELEAEASVGMRQAAGQS